MPDDHPIQRLIDNLSGGNANIQPDEAERALYNLLILSGVLKSITLADIHRLVGDERARK
jgi:hypothetical protein